MVEILVVIAILGVLLSIGFLVLPRDRILVNQAVERFERDLQRSRFNAISYNTRVLFAVDPANDRYGAAPIPNVAGVQRARFTVDLAAEGLGGVEIAPVNSGGATCDGAAPTGSGEWQFDSRGVGRFDGITLVTFRHAGSGFAVSLCVNAYGRVERL